jgi:hypothetical protein
MPAEKTQPFCPCSRVLNWTGKGLTQAHCCDHTQQEEPSVLVHCPPAHSPCWSYITATVTKAIVFPARQGSLHYQDLYACLGTVTHIHGWTLTFNWACNTTSNTCQMKLWLNSSVRIQFLQWLGYGLDDLGFNSKEVQESFPFSKIPWLALSST